MAQVYQIPLVDPEEALSQLRLQRTDFAGAGLCPLQAVEKYPVIAALDTDDAVHRQRAPAASQAQCDHLGGLCRELGQGTAEHGGKPCLVYRLEEVVEGPHVKGVVDIVLVAGDKDQQRLAAQREGPDGSGQGRAVSSGQGHVYKEQVHRCPAGEALLCGGVLGDAAGLSLLLDQMGEAGPGAGLVVTDGNVDHTCFLESYIGWKHIGRKAPCATGRV